MTTRSKILATISDERLRPLERLTMVALLSTKDPSNPKISEITGLSRSAVCRHLAKFEELGLITRQKSGRTGRVLDYVGNL